MLLRKVEHIGIFVRDMDRSVRFYTEVLGLPLTRRVKVREGVEAAFLAIGDSEIELLCRQGEYSFAAEGIVNHLAFRVDDVAAVLEHLRQHGVELIHQQPVELGALGVRIAFFKGPDGEKLELMATM